MENQSELKRSGLQVETQPIIYVDDLSKCKGGSGTEEVLCVLGTEDNHHCALTLSISAPSSGSIGDNINISFSKSGVEGKTDGNPHSVTYNWSITGCGISENGSTSSETKIVTPTEAGEISVVFSATCDEGCTIPTATKTIYINSSCSIDLDITAPDYGVAGKDITIDFTYTGAAGYTDGEEHSVTYSWSISGCGINSNSSGTPGPQTVCRHQVDTI